MFFKSYVFLKNGVKIHLRGLVKEIQKKLVKSQALLKNCLKIVACLDKEIQKTNFKPHVLLKNEIKIAVACLVKEI